MRKTSAVPQRRLRPRRVRCAWRSSAHRPGRRQRARVPESAGAGPPCRLVRHRGATRRRTSRELPLWALRTAFVAAFIGGVPSCATETGSRSRSSWSRWMRITPSSAETDPWAVAAFAALGSASNAFTATSAASSAVTMRACSASSSPIRVWLVTNGVNERPEDGLLVMVMITELEREVAPRTRESVRSGP